MRGLEGGQAAAVVGLFLASALAGCASDPYAPETTTETGFGARVVPGTGATGGETGDDEFGDVAGVVLNEAGIALPGAKVSLPGAVLGVTTGVGGRFEFSDIPPGAQTIRVEKEGYQTLVRSITVVAGHVTEVEAVLARARGLNEGSVDHVHDFWLGQHNYTVFEDEIDVRREADWSALARPTEDYGYIYWYPIIPETGKIVPPGTARVKFDIEIEPGTFFPQTIPNAPEDRYELWVYPPKTIDPMTGATKKHDRQYVIKGPSSSIEFILETPLLVDHGHATATSWTFGLQIWSSLSMHGAEHVAYDDNFMSPVSVTITAQKGDLLVDPPHPRYWKDSDRLVMNATRKASIDCGNYHTLVTPNAPDCPRRLPNPRFLKAGDEGQQSCASRIQTWSGGGPGMGGCLLLDVGSVVPVATTRIEFDLEHAWASQSSRDPNNLVSSNFEPDKFVLGYKTAKVATQVATWSDYTWLEPTGTFPHTPPSGYYWAEGRRYTITVKPDEADPFYARVSDWVFAVAVKGHEADNDWDAVTCRTEQCGWPGFQIKNFTVINENRDEMLKEGEA